MGKHLLVAGPEAPSENGSIQCEAWAELEAKMEATPGSRGGSHSSTLWLMACGQGTQGAWAVRENQSRGAKHEVTRRPQRGDLASQVTGPFSEGSGAGPGGGLHRALSTAGRSGVPCWCLGLS